ncbi:MAG: Holliday junction resolvase RuvX, partial [Synergistaceae bacterium]|nr:Holliday junction resolvase RuvX [Synergistaceae bacterium]
RTIALDIGTVRIGVAVSDPFMLFAQGLTVLSAEGGWMEELAGIIKTYDARAMLVGMPRRTDGSYGPEAERMKAVIAELSARFPEVEVIPWDERFTTVIATQALLEADVPRKGRRTHVDKVASTLLLQGYIDYLRKNQAGCAEQALFTAKADVRRAKRKGKNKNYD